MHTARLAFIYHPRSFGVMEIAEAADGVCELVWVIDRDLGDTASMVRLLARLGTVVDITGLGDDAAAARIAEQRPDGILALADSLLARTAQLAQRLGLAFHTPATARALGDKHAQRTALRAAGLTTPGFWPVPADGDEDGWAALAGAATFPAVVKPRRSELSRDTLPVASLPELRAVVDAMPPGDRDQLELEAYIPDRPGRPGPFADYVSVESLVSAGHISHLAVNGRFPPAEPFRETGFFIPAALPAEERDAALALATAAVRALGVTGGCLHTEIKMTPAGPCVIEVNGRIGGGVTDMLRAAAGVELMPIALRLALGDTVRFAAPPATHGVAYILLIQPPAILRRVIALEGVEEVRALPGVEAVVVQRGAGAEVDWHAGTNEYLALVRGHVADHEELADLAAQVRATIRATGATLSARAPA